MKILKIVFFEMRRRPFFSFLNLFGVAITFAIVMLFAIKLETELAPTSPEVNLDRTLYIWRTNYKLKNGNTNNGNIAKSLLEKYFRNMKTAEAVTFFQNRRWSIPKRDKINHYRTQEVDPSFFIVNEFEFVEGRGINKQQYEGKERVIVISEKVKEAFFDQEKVVGEYFSYQKKQYKVIGVVKNVSRACQYVQGDIWYPNSISSSSIGNGVGGQYSALAMLHSANDVDKARKEMATIMKRINLDLEGRGVLHINGPNTVFETMHMTNNDKVYAGNFTVWMKKVGQLLAILILPILNIISLNITSLNERSEEIAIRKSFGAHRWAIIKQLVAENIILTTLGALLGLLSALLLAYQIPSLIYEDFGSSSPDTLYTVHVNFMVFFFALVLTLLFAVVSGFFPALKISKVETAQILKGVQS